jgi:hypothetical protein
MKSGNEASSASNEGNDSRWIRPCLAIVASLFAIDFLHRVFWVTRIVSPMVRDEAAYNLALLPRWIHWGGAIALAATFVLLALLVRGRVAGWLAAATVAGLSAHVVAFYLESIRPSLFGALEPSERILIVARISALQCVQGVVVALALLFTVASLSRLTFRRRFIAASLGYGIALLQATDPIVRSSAVGFLEGLHVDRDAVGRVILALFYAAGTLSVLILAVHAFRDQRGRRSTSDAPAIGPYRLAAPERQAVPTTGPTPFVLRTVLGARVASVIVLGALSVLFFRLPSEGFTLPYYLYWTGAGMRLLLLGPLVLALLEVARRLPALRTRLAIVATLFALSLVQSFYVVTSLASHVVDAGRMDALGLRDLTGSLPAGALPAVGGASHVPSPFLEQKRQSVANAWLLTPCVRWRLCRS